VGSVLSKYFNRHFKWAFHIEGCGLQNTAHLVGSVGHFTFLVGFISDQLRICAGLCGLELCRLRVTCWASTSCDQITPGCFYLLRVHHIFPFHIQNTYTGWLLRVLLALPHKKERKKPKKNHKPLDIFTQPLYVGCEQTPGPFHTMLT
jgi:hypothetical protein